MTTREGMDLDEMAREVEQELEAMVGRATVDRGEYVLDLFRQLRAGWELGQAARRERAELYRRRVEEGAERGLRLWETIHREAREAARSEELDGFAVQASAALGTLVTAQFQAPLPASSMALAVQTLARVALGEETGPSVLKARAAQSEAHRAAPLMSVDPETWEEMLGTGPLARQVTRALCVLQRLEEWQENLFAQALPAGTAFARGYAEGMMARAGVHVSASSTGRCWCWAEATPGHATQNQPQPVTLWVEAAGFPHRLYVTASRLVPLSHVRDEALLRVGRAHDSTHWLLFHDDGRTPVDPMCLVGVFYEREVAGEWAPCLYLGERQP